MRRPIIPLAAALIPALAAAAATAPPPLAAGAKPCLSLTAASAEEAQGAASQRFSASRTTDLTFRLYLDPALTGAHTVELRVFTPRGFLYRSLAVPVSLGSGARASAASAGEERLIAGYPHPLKVHAATRDTLAGAAVQRVEVAFPVGGTDIVSNSVYGKWKVEPYLDGGATSCGPAATFRITQ